MTCLGVKLWYAGGRTKAIATIVAVVTFALIACHRTTNPIDEVSTHAHDTTVVTSEARQTQNNDMMKSDPFLQFRSAVSEYFAPVAEDFALGAPVERTIYPEMYIEFRGDSTRLGVGYGLESQPWVYVVITTAGGHERRFGLHTIVEHRAGTRRSFDELANVSDLEARVRALSDLTRQHVGSLLTERTANLRQLYLLSQKALREREQEMGLDPTLAPKPTLPQLFQACDPAVRAVCAYHAVVDYSYSTDEVAAFLTVRRDDVQRMIDHHDTLR